MLQVAAGISLDAATADLHPVLSRIASLQLLTPIGDDIVGFHPEGELAEAQIRLSVQAGAGGLCAASARWGAWLPWQ